jgi:hypothetical protein
MPALHWAITNSGPEIINKGEPITGTRKFCRTEGKAMIFFLLRITVRNVSPSSQSARVTLRRARISQAHRGI